MELFTDEDFNDLIKGKNLTEDQTKAFLDLTQNMRDGKVVINSTDDAMVAYSQSLKGVQTQAKTAAVKTKVLSGAMKALSSIGWMVIITLIVEGIRFAIKEIDKYINRVKYAKEAMVNAQESIISSQKRLKEVTDTISSNKDRFLELSEGVNEFSKNLKLSEDEYAEYLSLCNEFADISPSLVYGYDEQGNALLNIGKNAGETAEKLNEVLEAEKNLTEQELVKNKGKLAESIYTQVKDAYDIIDNLKLNLKDHQVENPLFFIEDSIISSADSSISTINTRQMISQLGMEKVDELAKKLSSIDSFDYNREWEQMSFSSDDLEIVKKSIEEFYTSLGYYEKNKSVAYVNGIKQDIKKQEQTIKSLFSQYNSTLLAWVKSTYEYDFLDEEQRAFIDALIPSIDWKLIKDETGKAFASDAEYEEYIKNNYIIPLMSIPDEYKDDINQKFTELLSLESGSIEAYNFAKELQEELKNIGIVIDLKFLTNGSEEVVDNFNLMKDSIARDIVGVEVGESMHEGQRQYYNNLTYKIDQFAKEYSINTQDEIAAFNDAWEKANGDIDKAFEYYLQQLEEKSESQTLSLPDISTTIDNLNTKVKPVLDSLKSAYQDIFTENGFTLDNVGVDMLNSVKEAISEINEIDGIDITTSTFEDFARILTDTTTTEEQAHEAFNSLVTEIIHGTDVTKVSADAFNTLVQSLEEMGVVNASEALNGLKTIQDKIVAQGSDIINITEDEAEGFLKEAEALGISAQWLKTFTLQKAIAENPLDTTKDIEALENLCKVLGVTGEMLEYVNDIKYANQMIEIHEKTGLGAPVEAYQATINSAKQKIQKLLDEGTVFEFDFKFDGGKDDNGSGTSSNTPSDTYFDWIETKLDKLNDQLDKTKEKAEDTFNGWKIRADAFTDAENQIESLIATQEEAKARYLEEADKSGLPDKYKELVQDGTIDIDKLSNDNPLKEQIESYQEWYDKVKQCDEAIDELNADLKQLYRDKREFRWEVFDYLEDSISRITGETDYLVELLSSEDLFDDNGNFTKYADATLGLHVSNLQSYKQQALDYKEEMESLENDLANGGGQEVLDKYNERVDAHRDAINAIQKEKQAILDLVEEGYNAQLDALNKLIDKKKESLNAEKDLYDYQQSIAEKTKNISSLEKRKLALSGDTSEEAKSQLQQIEVELEEARKDLEQTEWEKELSETEKMLDQLSSDYEQWIEQRLENSDTLLQQIIDNLSADGSINATLQEIAKKNGTFVSDELTSSISDGANSSINSYLDEIIKLLGGDDSFFGNAGNKIKGYASGTKRSGKEWAWTQEKGVEFIRTKDGALLTPLNNSMVYNNESSKRLWEFSQNPSAFLEKFGMNNIIQPIFNIPKLPNIERPSNQTPINNITHMEVILPSVTNYDDFMNRIQNDKRFDNIVTASMNSKMTGSNSLSKFRF